MKYKKDTSYLVYRSHFRYSYPGYESCMVPMFSFSLSGVRRILQVNKKRDIKINWKTLFEKHWSDEKSTWINDPLIFT